MPQNAECFYDEYILYWVSLFFHCYAEYKTAKASLLNIQVRLK
jgi:hypothetical protein